MVKNPDHLSAHNPEYTHKMFCIINAIPIPTNIDAIVTSNHSKVTVLNTPPIYKSITDIHAMICGLLARSERVLDMLLGESHGSMPRSCLSSESVSVSPIENKLRRLLANALMGIYADDDIRFSAKRDLDLYKFASQQSFQIESISNPMDKLLKNIHQYLEVQHITNLTARDKEILTQILMYNIMLQHDTDKQYNAEICRDEITFLMEEQQLLNAHIKKFIESHKDVNITVEKFDTFLSAMPNSNFVNKILGKLIKYATPDEDGGEFDAQHPMSCPEEYILDELNELEDKFFLGDPAVSEYIKAITKNILKLWVTLNVEVHKGKGFFYYKYNVEQYIQDLTNLIKKHTAQETTQKQLKDQERTQQQLHDQEIRQNLRPLPRKGKPI
jgi:hypothetical protein